MLRTYLKSRLGPLTVTEAAPLLKRLIDLEEAPERIDELKESLARATAPQHPGS